MREMSEEEFKMSKELDVKLENGSYVLKNNTGILVKSTPYSTALTIANNPTTSGRDGTIRLTLDVIEELQELAEYRAAKRKRDNAAYDMIDSLHEITNEASERNAISVGGLFDGF